MPSVPQPTRRALTRLLTATTLFSSTVVVALTAGSPSAALAATPCARADLHHRQVLDPGTYADGARFGAVTAAGDFNNDGYADVAVGSPADKVGTAAAGSVWVYLGSDAGLGGGKRLTQLNVPGSGAEAGDQFGAALAVGDFNGDRFADLAVASPGEAIGDRAKSGAVAIFKGSAAGVANTATGIEQALLGATNEANDQFGHALAAGNFNGDGYTDLAVGIPGETPGSAKEASGEVAVLKGSGSGLGKGWWYSQSEAGGANETGDRFGAALAAGNVTGSGHTDLVVGAPNEKIDPAAGAGGVYVFPGSAAGDAPGFARNQSPLGGANEAGDNFGASLAVGDFDNNGTGDIAIGVPNEATSSVAQLGAVAVFSGPVSKDSTDGFWLTEGFTGEATADGDRFGAALAVGNADGDPDGYADLLVGAPGSAKGGPKNAGSAYLFRGHKRVAGSKSSLAPAQVLTQPDVIASNETSDAFGSAVTLAQINKDGRADAVIGAPGEAVPGRPRSGTAVWTTNLVQQGSTHPLERFSPTTAVQSPPAGGRVVGPIRYAYTDNLGAPRIGTQPNPENVSSVQWDNGGTLDARFAGRPAVGQLADGRGVVAARTVKGEVWIRTQTSPTEIAWSDWVNYGGPDIGALTMATMENGKLAVFGIGAGGALMVLPEAEAGRFGAWQGTGLAGLTGEPVAVKVSGGTRLFARDTGGILRTALYANLTLTGCTAVGDTVVTGTPAVVVYPGSAVRVFATTPDQALLTVGQDDAGAFESTWQTVRASGVAGSPAAVLDSTSGKVTVVARGADGGIYGSFETAQGSATWGEWQRLSHETTVSATDVTMVPYTSEGRSAFLFTFRTQDNEQIVYYPQNASRAALARAGATRSFTAKVLPKAPEPTR